MAYTYSCTCTVRTQRATWTASWAASLELQSTPRLLLGQLTGRLSHHNYCKLIHFGTTRRLPLCTLVGQLIGRLSDYNYTAQLIS